LDVLRAARTDADRERTIFLFHFHDAAADDLHVAAIDGITDLRMDVFRQTVARYTPDVAQVRRELLLFIPAHILPDVLHMQSQRVDHRLPCDPSLFRILHVFAHDA